ncbi:lactonase family protein [Sphingobium sp. BHU LFT2]|uniref:lactonase family protein n=1 Tax=Sphingobium sp. BHU LFT2 TaxID=2807634 RepID=UPI001BE89F5B|nr:beta-propeller fold lactonase family protein [Sphingobium sp. BHU LFT2]MBT2246129.1 lactonase family protein [Sphingobium sp. BHU LFT2]
MSHAARLIAYVGSYGCAPGATGGGIYALAVAADGSDLRLLSRVEEPKEAGYLVYAPETRTLYAVDERKTDGRGPVDPPAAVHAFAVESNGALRFLNSQNAPGPRPTFLDYHAGSRSLVCANHGDFQHVEKVVRLPDGGWGTDYVYDDSTLLLYGLEADGCIGALRDVQVFDGHGQDPNFSPQNGGHAQASSHAHCAVIDPSGRYVIVCDKGTDCIHSFRLGDRLEPAATLQMAPGTGPRHIAFDVTGGHAFATLEFASELAALRFDAETGAFTPIDRVSTVASDPGRVNEPADVRIHRRSGCIYVNNRGEDSLAWFALDGAKLSRRGAVPLAPSIHPGLAARSFAFDPTGALLLVADRPAHLVRAYAVDANTGALSPLTDIALSDPAFIAFVELDAAPPCSGDIP